MTTALRDMIANPTTAELELVARYGMQPEDSRRERLFEAFSRTGLPHRRLEAWKWTDFKVALQGLVPPRRPRTIRFRMLAHWSSGSRQMAISRQTIFRTG